MLAAEVVDKEQEYRFDPAAGRWPRRCTGRAGAPSGCLDRRRDAGAGELAKRIEQHRGAPQDIEWAMADNGDVHVLQVRPETVWSNRATEQLVAAPATAISQVLARFAGVGVTRSSGATGA